MSGVILYQSKYVATKRYADWLSEGTGFKCIETKKADINEITTYDYVILGGGVYASGIAGLSFLKKNINKLKGKKVILFCCGASQYDENAFQQIKEHNLKDSLPDIPVFYCRGSLDIDAMSFKDRILCKLLIKATIKKDPSDYEIWEKALMEARGGKCDWTDKKYIEPILECIKR